MNLHTQRKEAIKTLNYALADKNNKEAKWAPPFIFTIDDLIRLAETEVTAQGPGILLAGDIEDTKEFVTLDNAKKELADAAEANKDNRDEAEWTEAVKRIEETDFSYAVVIALMILEEPTKFYTLAKLDM